MSTGRAIASFLLLACAVAGRLDAQVTETPVPFDGAGKVPVLTAALVASFGLVAPAWPASGEFRSARLFSVSTGGHVLAVERESGAVDRFQLSEEQVTALRGAVGVALAATVHNPAIVRDAASVEARGAFARNQMILSAILYGPLIASFADDGKTATALYLISVGGSFFAVTSLARNTAVSRSQNGMATDGALRGYAGVSGLLFSFAGDEVNRKLYSALGLAGALGGAKVGFEYGRGLADNQGQAARKISTLSAATMFGLLGAFDVYDQPEFPRPVAGAVVAAGLAGYLLGPTYPARVSYSVTAGDVRFLHIGALLGLGVGVTAVAGGTGDDQLPWAVATAGMLAGVTVMERTWVRRYDHSHADATITWLGTTAGALLGGAVAVLARPVEEPVAVGLVTSGALLGAFAAHRAARPERAAPRGAELSRPQQSKSRESVLRFDPGSLLFAAARVPGRHAVLALRF